MGGGAEAKGRQDQGGAQHGAAGRIEHGISFDEWRPPLCRN
jgi:hypothetical protein